MGTPCDPFSEQRNKRYSDGSVASHPLFDVTFKDAVDMLTSHHSPNCSILEQVLGFSQPISRTDDTSPMQRPGFCFGDPKVTDSVLLST